MLPGNVACGVKRSTLYSCLNSLCFKKTSLQKHDKKINIFFLVITLEEQQNNFMLIGSVKTVNRANDTCN